MLSSKRQTPRLTRLPPANAALLAESLEVIQRTAAVILSTLETDSEEKETEPEIEHGPALARAS